MTKARIVLAVLGLTVLASCSSGGTTTSSSTTSAPAMTTTTTSAPSAPPASLDPYLALWPFQSAQEVQSWQSSFASTGQGSWHLDASATALDFTMSYLGLKEVNVVVSSTTDSKVAHVSVGYRPSSSQTATAAVIHLVRWGTGSHAPWEVVGTDDTSFSLTTPPYGATVSSPMGVGGVISGVDESIRVTVLEATATTQLGTFCCRAAGGNASPWSAAVSFTTPNAPIMTVLATTGGHVQQVERFTVTGVRQSSS